MKKFLFSILIFAGIVSMATAEHLVMISTNDCHSTIDPNDNNLGGLLRRRVVIDSIRAAEAKAGNPTLLIDAGDQVQGSLYFTLYEGAVEYASIDSLGYDIIILGNHEFDNTLPETAAFYRNVRAQKVCSNYDFDQTAMRGMFYPYIVKRFGDKRVAFIGINLNPDGKISSRSYTGMLYNDGKKVACELSTYLKKSGIADYVVLISHIGYDESNENSPTDLQIAAASTDIDIIIGGDSHTFIDPAEPQRWQIANAAGRKIAVTQTGAHGVHVNKIDLDLATGKVGYESILIDSRLDARANADYPAFKEWLRPYCSEVQALNGNIIGTCARFMINRDNSDAGLSNWAADALYEAGLKQFGKIDFAVMNTGGLRKPLPEGKISEGRLVEIMPFKNSLTVVEMTGDVLTEMLTQMASKGKAVPSKQVSGTYYKKSNTIDVRINGKKIKPTQTYRVITVDYLANGGDYLYAFTKGRKVWEDKEPYRGYILDYIRDLDSRGIKVDGPAKMRVVTK
ncbi:MAG: bifunctional metallophosphatase/5'-nucleotidase [Muribaculaceae bacterium]|nr:bifunctional metallophosphatase/5'-nucleotidase [Muribaculaceae bacterium]